jgi:hypothetical protein
MKISDLDQPRIGDIVEFETDPETVVEGVIVGETDDGYIYEFSDTGYTELHEACTYGKYYCSTDKKYKCRQSPKQDRDVAEAHGNSKIYDKCWDGYKKVPGKKRGEKGSCVEESSGYIPRNSREAQDPRWSSALTGDVTTSTMRDQIGKFFPTTAPNDGQEQIHEAQYQGREVPLGRPMRGDVKKFKVYVKDPGTGNVKKVNFGDPNMRIKKSNPARRRSFRARHNCKTPGPRTKARYWSCRKW